MAFIGISQIVYTNDGQPSFEQPKKMTDIGLGVAYRPKCPPRDERSTFAVLEHSLSYSVAEPESRLQNIGNRSTGRRPWLFFPSPHNHSNPRYIASKLDVMAYNLPTARTVMAFSASLVGQLSQRVYGILCRRDSSGPFARNIHSQCLSPQYHTTPKN